MMTKFSSLVDDALLPRLWLPTTTVHRSGSNGSMTTILSWMTAWPALASSFSQTPNASLTPSVGITCAWSVGVELLLCRSMTKFPARSALVSAPRMKSFPFFSCAKAAASMMLGCPGSNARNSTADFAPSIRAYTSTMSGGVTPFALFFCSVLGENQSVAFLAPGICTEIGDAFAVRNALLCNACGSVPASSVSFLSASQYVEYALASDGELNTMVLLVCAQRPVGVQLVEPVSTVSGLP